ncbi:hypothetical protein U2P60_20240 [Brucella sp. H1_1004]|uniref:hypothetical protein n=1 Tax=Brucella sp. H1_1004 TaxID=3110109 RepID=UPI0039B67683
MKILILMLGLIQVVIGLIFIVEANSVQRLTLGTLSFGFGSICCGIAVIIGRLDALRTSFKRPPE